MADETPRLQRLADLLDDFMITAEKRYEAHKACRTLGPITGFPTLDHELGGFLAAGVHFVHGGPGTGKTALAWQIAARCGCQAMFVSCELAPWELVARAIAREEGTYLAKVKSGELPPDVLRQKAQIALGRCEQVFLVDATRCWPSVGWLEEHIRILLEEHPHVLVCLDSVHTWSQGLPGGAGEYEVLTAAIDALRSLALTLETPILGIAERNRVAMRTGGLHAAAGTRRFEYASESLIDLSRPDDAADGLPGALRQKSTGFRPVFPGTAAVAVAPVQVSLVKNRHGATGSVTRLTFEGRRQLFVEEAVV